jgi:hypothetical protein
MDILIPSQCLLPGKSNTKTKRTTLERYAHGGCDIATGPLNDLYIKSSTGPLQTLPKFYQIFTDESHPQGPRIATGGLLLLPNGFLVLLP